VTHTRQLILTLTMAIVAVAQPARNTAYAFYDNESSLRLQITPRETEVFMSRNRCSYGREPAFESATRW